MGFKRRLKLFFERELEHLEGVAWLPRFRRPGKPSPPMRVSARRDSSRESLPKSSDLPGRKRIRPLRSWTTGASSACSVTIHAMLFAFLAASRLPPVEKEKPREIVFQLRLRPSRSPKPSAGPEGPPTATPEAPPLDSAGQQEDQPAVPGPDGGDSTRKDPLDSELARGRPVEQSTSLTDLAPPPPLPRSIGLGTGAPPLPGSGDGVVRGFSSRGEGKGDALRRYGGGGTTESAVGQGLRWLAEHQDDGGGWSAEGFQRHCRQFVPCPGNGLSEFDVGVTALATLAFLGAGHVPGTPGSIATEFRAGHAREQPAKDGGPYRQVVEQALDYLLSHQAANGVFGAVGENYFYNHSLATFAMAEAFAMTGQPRYQGSVQRAIDFSVSAQQSGGGWDYTSKASGRNDLSITGWQVMALRTAARAGILVPEPVWRNLERFLDAAVTADGEGIYANLGQEAGRRGINMVAVGLLSKIYMGALPAEPRVRRAAERLLKEPPDWQATSRWEDTYQSYYYWYTASLALFHLGGEQWKAWNFFLLRSLLPVQSKKPHELGSWPPEASWLGVSGGRVYATAMGILTLEVYYRYEPMFKAGKS